MSTVVEEPTRLASTNREAPFKSWPLLENWRFRERGEDTWRTASVPGNNYLDLMAADLISDPFIRANERDVQWVAEKDWEYVTTFEVATDTLEMDCVDLVFKGVDTYAEVYLNDTHILTCENMFREYRCAVKDVLAPGENILRVCLASPLQRVRPMAAKAGVTYPAENDHSDEKLSVFTRKAPYQYGWDWGARLVPSGLWRPVSLEAYDGARISNINHRINSLTEESAALEFDIEIDSAFPQEVAVEVKSTVYGFHGQTVSASVGGGRHVVCVPVRVSAPKLWWPNGHGDQFLYDVDITLIVDGGRQSIERRRIGLRTIRVLTDEDEIGQQFTVEVNGTPLFMKGANYIPSDSFPERMTLERYRDLFASIKDANMNMVRVWGGGIYEDDAFYDLADENGILIWQDFMFACTLYPATEEMLRNIEAEVRDNVRRLRSHACIALWCGNNEIEMGIKAWDWPKKFGYDGETTAALNDDYDELFRRRLPAWLAEEDASRFYLSSSPSGSWEDEIDDNRGDSHYWGVWHGGEPFSEYERRIPRFMSEFGFQSLPDIASVEMFTEPSDRNLSSDVMKVHQKHSRGYSLITQYMETEYTAPESFASFLYLSQVQQAEGLKKAFAAHRLARPHCMGTLFWQLNDCWPVASWSAIDYYGRKKALYYEARRCFSPVAVFAREVDGRVSVDGVNDTDAVVSGGVALSLMQLDGEVLWSKTVPLVLWPQQKTNATIIPFDELPGANKRSDQIFVATYTAENGDTCRDILKFVASKNMQMVEPLISLNIEQSQGDTFIDVSASSFASGVYLSAPSAFGVLDLADNFISLLPGERRSLLVKRGTPFGSADLADLSVRAVQSPEGAFVDVADAGVYSVECE